MCQNVPSIARVAAGALGFLIFSHAFDGPDLYGALSFFETMPSIYESIAFRGEPLVDFRGGPLFSGLFFFAWVSARVAEIQYGGAASVLAELETARLLALKLGQASAAVAATMGKAKILGLIIDRREVGEVGAFDHMTDDELVEEAKKRAAALGLSPDPKLVN
jgi:hypothetical protein